MRILKFTLILILAIAASTFCLWRYQKLTEPAEKSPLYASVGQKIKIRAIVVAESSPGSYGQKLFVRAPDFSDEKILVSAPFYPEFHYGDEIEIYGKLALPEDFETDSGTIFHYVKYLQEKGVRFQMNATSQTKKVPHPVVLISEHKGNIVIDGLLRLKLSILTHIRAIILRPQSGLFEGLVLGENTLPQKVQDEFRMAGIIHIVVLSGYNMTLVADAVSSTLSFLPLIPRLAGSAVGVVLFALMAGPSATVVRATIMSILAMLARATGRLYDVKRALWVSGALMILENPLILFYDPSFQLSFLATFGLIYFSPFFTWIFSRGVLARWPDWALKEIIISSCATQAVVLPFLIHMTGSVSIISLVANCAVLPFIPIAMSVGSVAALFSFISASLAMPVAYLADLVLSYIIAAAHFFANIPYATVAAPSSWVFTLSIYMVYAVFWLFSLARAKNT